VLSELLQFDPPALEQRHLPCSCGHTANYLEIRCKPILTAVGKAQCVRPYYLCAHCHRGQFPADVELDIENTELSPSVRRMLAAVGQDAPFEHGREQIKQLAGLNRGTARIMGAVGVLRLRRAIRFALGSGLRSG
jgi:hypothetical protein